MVEFLGPYPALYVSDVQRSLAFYRDVLGFQIGYRWPPEGDPDYVEVTQGNQTVGLLSREFAARETGLPVAQGGPSWAELVLEVDDVDAASRYLLSKGVRQLREPADKPWGERVAYFVDPDGHPIFVAAKLP